MARNSSGTYSLPAGNPVVSGTTIQSSWANTTLSDIATALTNSLDRTGKGAMQAPLLITDGAVGASGVAFNNEPTSGLYRNGASDVRFALTGADLLRMGTGELTVESDVDDATAGPFLKLFRNSISPAASDLVGQLLFDGQNDAAERVSYAALDANIETVTDGAEDGGLSLKTMRAGTLTEAMSIDSAGNVDIPVALTADNLTVSTSISLPAGSLAIADTNGLEAALNGKQPVISGGSANDTIRYNGAAWAATSLLQVDANRVTIDSNSTSMLRLNKTGGGDAEIAFQIAGTNEFVIGGDAGALSIKSGPSFATDVASFNNVGNLTIEGDLFLNDDETIQWGSTVKIFGDSVGGDITIDAIAKGVWSDNGTKNNNAQIVVLTQAQYDALTPDADTLYMITA